MSASRRKVKQRGSKVAPVACAITCSASLEGRKIFGRTLAAWRTQAIALAARIDDVPGPKQQRKQRQPVLASIEIHICDAREMAVLNYRHLQHRGATDVLTFPMDASEVEPARSTGARPRVSGVVVVCPTVAEAEARERGLPPEEELLRYILHGALHLLGEDDKTAAKHKRMHARQEMILERFLRRA